MSSSIRIFFQDESGASAVEYGLIIALISVALVVVLGMLGGGTTALFSSVCSHLPGAPACS